MTNIEVMKEREQTWWFVNKMKASFIHCSLIENGRFETPYHYEKAGRKTRQGETKRTHDNTVLQHGLS